MTKDKTTPGTVRYSDGNGHNLYFKKSEAEEMGNPDTITVTVTTG